MRSWFRKCVVAALVWVWVGSAPAPALARRPSRPAAPAASKGEALRPAGPARTPVSEAELETLKRALVGSEADAAETAAQRLGGTGQEAAVDALVEALALGTWPQLTIRYLQALGRLNHTKALQVLVLYAGNRHPDVRVAAVQALAPMQDDGAAGLLIERLGDADATVRAAAAAALAGRKDVRAVPRLFQLVKRSDVGAAVPLGLLAPLDLAPQVAELRGTIDDGTLSSALAEFLKRSDAPDRLRVDLVRTLGRVPGAEATTALVEYLASVPEGEARPSKEEAETLLEQRSAE